MTDKWDMVCTVCGKVQIKGMEESAVKIMQPGYCQSPCVGPLEWRLQK